MTRHMRLHRSRWGRGAVAGAIAAALVGSWAVNATSAGASARVRTLSIFAGTATAGPATPGPATRSDLDGPFGSAVDGVGDVYFAEANNNEIDKVTPAGTLSIVAGTGTAGPSRPGPARSSELDFPDGLAIDQLGDLFVADAGNNEIDEITAGGTLSIVAGTGTAGEPTPGPATRSEFNLPYGVAVDHLGDLYVADANNDEVEKVSPTGILSVVAGTGKAGPPTPGPATRSELNFPTGVAVDALGDLYIADAFNSDIEEVTPGGALSIFAGDGKGGSPTRGPSTSSHLNHPYGVGLDGSGNVYIADTFNHALEEVTPSRQLSVIAGTGSSGTAKAGPAGSSGLGQPTGVAIDPLGNIYLADFEDDEVDRITAPDGGGATVAITTPDGHGYLRATASGHVDNHGTAFHGSPYTDDLTSPVAGIGATPGGDYVLATAVGNVHAYGTAFHGSPFSDHLTSPIAGIAVTSGGDYVLATAVGNVHAYGTAFHGSPFSDHLTSPVVGIAGTSGGGYLVVTASGGVYNYGTAFHGSPHGSGVTLASPIVGIAATARGYVLATASGVVFAYGTPFHGSPSRSDVALNAPVTGIAAAQGGGYVLTTSAGATYSYDL